MLSRSPLFGGKNRVTFSLPVRDPRVQSREQRAATSNEMASCARALDPICRQCVYRLLNFPRKDANSPLESTDLFSKIISLSGKRGGLFLLSEALTLFRLQCFGKRRKAFFRYGLELGNAVSFLLQSIGKNGQLPLNGIPRFGGCPYYQ